VLSLVFGWGTNMVEKKLEKKQSDRCPGVGGGRMGIFRGTESGRIPAWWLPDENGQGKECVIAHIAAIEKCIKVGGRIQAFGVRWKF